MARNQLSPEEATRRISAQMPQEEKMRYADYLIETSEGFESARRETEKVYQALKAEATLKRADAQAGRVDVETRRRVDEEQA